MTHNFLGPMLFREALANSRNIPALRVLEQVGVERTLNLLRQGGVKQLSTEPGEYGLTLAIGGLPVTAEELATLYTALANRGMTIPLRRYADSGTADGTRLLSPDSAVMIRNILSDASARRPAFPSGGPLDFDDYAVAVKTGTSQGYRDAWAAAFSDRLLVITWVGNHDLTRMNKISGAVVAGPIAHRILDDVMPMRAPHREWTAEFSPPTGWQAHEICALSGQIAGPGCTHHKTEYFAPGTEPTQACPFHRDVELDVRNGLLAGPTCPREMVITRPLLKLPEGYEAWARREKLEVAPGRQSPLCPAAFTDGAQGSHRRADGQISLSVRP